MVLDDPVMHDGQRVARDVRMRILRVRHAVRGPARVRDAAVAEQRRFALQALKLGDLALGAQALQALVGQNGHAGRVVAAVFEGLEARNQVCHHVALGADADDAAHKGLSARRIGGANYRMQRYADFCRTSGIARRTVGRLVQIP
jgi:hypothetical protein